MAVDKMIIQSREPGTNLEELKANFTETEKVILSRRSVRWYKNEQVPEFMVKRILEAGRFAPSAGNCQPWKFIVVRDAKLIDGLTKTIVMICKLFKAILEYRTPGNSWKFPIAKLYIRLMPKKLHPIPFGAVPLIADEKLGLYHGASTAILIFKDVRGVTNPDLDCGIAGQSMALAAHSMGLGTCWVSFASLAFDYAGLYWKRKFGIAYPYKFVTSLAVGWPVGKPDGFVERPVHAVDWYENGIKTVWDAGVAERAIGITERLHIPNYKEPTETHFGELAIDLEICSGCASCARICPASAITMQDKKPYMPPGVDCMACGDCMAICPKQAIHMKSDYRFTGHFKTIDHGKLEPPRLR